MGVCEWLAPGERAWLPVTTWLGVCDELRRCEADGVGLAEGGAPWLPVGEACTEAVWLLDCGWLADGSCIGVGLTSWLGVSVGVNEIVCE